MLALKGRGPGGCALRVLYPAVSAYSHESAQMPSDSLLFFHMKGGVGGLRSPLNIAQIVACVGQQNVEGARIRHRVENIKRSYQILQALLAFSIGRKHVSEKPPACRSRNNSSALSTQNFKMKCRPSIGGSPAVHKGWLTCETVFYPENLSSHITRQMLQVWIQRADVAPLHQGRDSNSAAALLSQLEQARNCKHDLEFPSPSRTTMVRRLGASWRTLTWRA